MAIPTLLLSPAGSRDRNGAVVPINSTPDRVDTVPGRYGPMWESIGTWPLVVPVTPYLDPAHCTVLVRWRMNSGSGAYIFGAGSYNRDWLAILDYGSTNTSRILFNSSARYDFPEGPIHNPGPIYNQTEHGYEPGDWAVAAIRCDAPVRDVWFQGVHKDASPYVPPVWTADHRVGFGTAANSVGATCEGILIYDTALPDAEIERISTMQDAWTWESVLPRFGGIVHGTPDPGPAIVRRPHAGPAIVGKAAEPGISIAHGTPAPIGIVRGQG